MFPLIITLYDEDVFSTVSRPTPLMARSVESCPSGWSVALRIIQLAADDFEAPMELATPPLLRFATARIPSEKSTPPVNVLLFSFIVSLPEPVLTSPPSPLTAPLPSSTYALVLANRIPPTGIVSATEIVVRTASSLKMTVSPGTKRVSFPSKVKLGVLKSQTLLLLPVQTTVEGSRGFSTESFSHFPSQKRVYGIPSSPTTFQSEGCTLVAVAIVKECQRVGFQFAQQVENQRVVCSFHHQAAGNAKGVILALLPLVNIKNQIVSTNQFQVAREVQTS